MADEGRCSPPRITLPDLRQYCIEELQNACPGDHECVEEGTTCWEQHPIHANLSVHGEILEVEGSVAAIVEVILKAVRDHQKHERRGGMPV